jgi:putative GTP pyrophosphokinase
MPLPDFSGNVDFLSHYKELMMLYENAVDFITMRLGIIQSECAAKDFHIPIRSYTSRIKEYSSLVMKLRKQGYPLTFRSILENMHDVGGVRALCEYIPDIYAVRDTLFEHDRIQLVEEKDYIKHPKSNGYRSLHLVVRVPVPLLFGVEMVLSEIQLRTTAMDSRAGLEHNPRYKQGRESTTRNFSTARTPSTQPTSPCRGSQRNWSSIQRGGNRFLDRMLPSDES